jgi:hypothetical protein
MNIQQNVSEYIARKKAGMHALLLHWAGTLESEAKQNAEWKDRLAHARQSIHSGVDAGANKFILYLAHGMRYGQYLEKGTGVHGPHKKPFVIRPKNKKALFWKGLPHPVKKVTIQGMKAQPIIKPTIEANMEKIGKSVVEYWRD